MKVSKLLTRFERLREALRQQTRQIFVVYGDEQTPAHAEGDLIVRVEYVATEPEHEGGAQASPGPGAAITPPQGPARPRPTGRTREAPIYAPYGNAPKDDGPTEAELAAEWYEEHVGELDGESDWW